MNDLIIRGMELPDRRTAELMHTELACVSRECDRHCENCELVQDRDELIVAFHEAIRVLETVANAVPLPEGHGKVIDADAIWRNMTDDQAWAFQRGLASDVDLFEILEAANAIVPAEGGGEK